MRDGKSLPDYWRSDSYEVFLRLHGQVQDEALVKLLIHRLPEEQTRTFSSHHYLALDHVRRGVPIPAICREEFEFLRSAGIVESEGRARGTRYFFNEALYDVFANKEGVGRRTTVDREASKARLLEYITDRVTTGAKLEELQEMLPGLSRSQIQILIRELKGEGLIIYRGATKAARWFPADKKQFRQS